MTVPSWSARRCSITAQAHRPLLPSLRRYLAGECGEGQHIDVAMLDCALMLMSSSVTNYSQTGQPPVRTAQSRNYIAAYGCYDALMHV